MLKKLLLLIKECGLQEDQEMNKIKVSQEEEAYKWQHRSQLIIMNMKMHHQLSKIRNLVDLAQPKGQRGLKFK